MVTFASLWQDQRCVFVFFRRWGCLFCRLWASEISEIADTLKENNVRLIGIGQDEIGLEYFISQNYFKGELYVDTDKQAYKDLNYKRYNYFTIVGYLLTPEAIRAGIKGARLGNNLRGDVLQIGGALVVSSGGRKVLLDYKQTRAAEHLPNSSFLESLGLAPSQPTESQQREFKQECVS